MTCPRCEHAEMERRRRDGVEIDRCEDCGGAWLDRGELDRLLARSRGQDAAPTRWRPDEVVP